MSNSTATPRKRQPSDGFRWIARARSLGLDGAQQAVLIAIAARLNREGVAFLAYDTIGSEAGIHRATAIRVVAQLIERGYVTAGAQTNGRVANTYSVTGDDAMQKSLFGDTHATPPKPKRRRKQPIHSSRETGKPPPQRLLAAFYAASKVHEQVGAMIDIGRALGVELDAGRLGRALKAGSKSEVAERLGLALFKNVEIPEGFALKNLNGRSSYAKARRPGRRAEGTASDDEARVRSGDF